MLCWVLWNGSCIQRAVLGIVEWKLHTGKEDRAVGNGKSVAIKKIVKLVGNAISALSILFVLSAMRRTGFDWSSVSDWRMFLFVCAAGILFKGATVFMSGSAWFLWLEFFSGKRCRRLEALCVYVKANIGKYLPGNVMHYVERNLFAGKLGLSHKQIVVASMAEAISLVLAAFSVGVAMAFPQMCVLGTEAIFGHPYQQKLQELSAYLGRSSLLQMRFGVAVIATACILLTVAMVALLWGRYRCKKIQKTRSGTGGAAETEEAAETATAEKTEETAKNVAGFVGAFLACFAIYAVVLIILGLILVLAYWYFGGCPTFRQAVLMVAAYMVAWVFGFVIPGAPGGIGVRELVLTLLLSPVAGQEMIITLGVLHRLITVLGDFVAYLMVVGHFVNLKTVLGF